MDQINSESNIGIVAFAFGVPHTIESNKVIAEMAVNLAKSTRGSIFTQLDVQFSEEKLPNGNPLDVSRATEEAGTPPPTLRIAREAAKWATERNLDQLHIVAAEPHIQRARRDVEQALKEINSPIKVCSCPDIIKVQFNLKRCPYLFKL